MMKNVKKRTAALLCCAALLISLCQLRAWAAGARYLVTAARANVLSAPDEAAAAVGEVYAGAYVYAEDESDGFLYITLRSAGVSGWVHSRYLRFADGERENPAGIKSIYIKSLPSKTVYEEDETPDFSGISVRAVYLDGGADRELQGWDLYCPALDAIGEKTVTVLYRAKPGSAVFTATFTVTVIKTPLKALTVVSTPDKTKYIERQPLDLSGLVLRATYTDGRAPRTFSADDVLSDPDFTLTGCHNEAPGALLQQGAHTLKISYKYPEISCSVAVTARERTVTALSITKMPVTTVYSKTEMPAFEGLELTADFDNGERETVELSQCTVFCDPSRFVLGSGNLAVISYGGKSVTLDLTLAQEETVGINVITPDVLAFVFGEPVDLSELKVQIVYASGRKEETQDYTVSGIDLTRRGAQTVTVRCGEYSEIFVIYIQEFYRRGDVTGDGEITAMDARLILRAAVGFINYQSDKLFNAADIDRDGNISAADARLALRAAVGLEEIV